MQVTHEDLYSRSFFCVELDRLRELHSTAAFKKLYWELAPLVQTLPELIHHLGELTVVVVGFATLAC